MYKKQDPATACRGGLYLDNYIYIRVCVCVCVECTIFCFTSYMYKNINIIYIYKFWDLFPLGIGIYSIGALWRHRDREHSQQKLAALSLGPRLRFYEALSSKRTLEGNVGTAQANVNRIFWGLPASCFWECRQCRRRACCKEGSHLSDPKRWQNLIFLSMTLAWATLRCAT